MGGAMIGVDYVKQMARYNRWMNERVYETASRLDDAQRKADRCAFFKSVHGTLNHIMWADTIWMGRFLASLGDKRTYPSSTAAGVDLYEDWHDLMLARSDMDSDILKWADHLKQDWLAQDFKWVTVMTQEERIRPTWLLVSHMFNHQTHHRGQVTTLLTQQGLDPGATDLVAMPE